MSEHWTEDDLILYFYGEGRRRVEIEQHLQRGPGTVFRACRELQRRFFDPPDFTGLSKYD